jgi:predicted Rossmann fold flavoprotein
VVDCLTGAAAQSGVRLLTRSGVHSVEVGPPGRPPFLVKLTGGGQVEADRVLVATGGGRASAGLAIAAALGHTVNPPVPSLFTFHIDDPRLQGLEGVSAPYAGASVAGTRLHEAGPVLVTHWGLSGPAILRVSAWGARELQGLDYRFRLVMNWVAPRATDRARADLEARRRAHPRRQVAGDNPFGLPARLWERLVAAAGINPGTTYANLARDLLGALALQATASEFAVTGKSLNKEEFVTCGGVRLDEVDMATMESRIRPGLHFAGEVLDIDGITGGFNLQAAWTTGWQAGRALGRTRSAAD